jgi:hypothetical protein
MRTLPEGFAERGHAHGLRIAFAYLLVAVVKVMSLLRCALRSDQ